MLCLYGWGSVFAQSNLPSCKGSDASRWSNCVGTVTHANGERYVGEFKDGKYNGQGTLTTANVGVYVGEWKDDRRNGQGTYTFVSGNKYVSEFKDDKASGQGTLTFANGDKYVGELKDYMRNGQGTLTTANGDIYVGEWKDDRRSGQGTRYASNGSIINQGIWDGGIFVRSVPVQQASAVNQTVAVAPTQLTGDCSLLFSKGINGNFAYLEVEFPQKKAFAIGVLHTGYQVCQYYNTINYNRNSDDEINKRAISECNKKMPGGTGCVLYATNNEIIYDKESHERQLNQNNSNQQASAVNQTVAVALQPDNSERDRLLAEVEAERKKRQELEEQLKVAQQPTQPNKPAVSSVIERRVALVIGNATYKVNPLKILSTIQPTWRVHCARLALT